MAVKTTGHLKLLGKERRIDFYQSKYHYYQNMTKWLIVISCIAYLTFFATDCQIFGHFAEETFFPRIIILLPLGCYLLAYNKIHNYRIMVFLSYLMIHMIIWCTDWATYLLPDRQYASEGMIIMNLIFVCAGFSAPFWYSTIAHVFFLVDMLVANCFIHYEDFGMMLLFNIPCVIAICFMHRVMEKVYLDHYLISQQLEDLVVHDQLTGVYNRNKLREISTIEGEELTFPRDLPIGVFLIDIDFFKSINDKYGHEAGDVVLKHTASILKSAVRSSDYVIRWGGEEFVLIVAGCPDECGVTVAEKIRKKVECGDNGVCPVTISIGVTTYQGGNYHDAIDLADRALYQAKNAGRNRVVQYKEES